MFYKNLAFLAIPITLQELLNSSVNMIDIFMIGRLGEQSVAAVGLANQIFFLFTLLCFGINSGASVFMGQYWGRRDIKNIHKIMGIAISLGLAAAGIFFILAEFFPIQVMHIYSKDSSVILLGRNYLKIIAFSYFLSAIIVSLNQSLRVIGKAHFPIITTTLSIVINIVCNYIFIFVLNLGVGGAALGTLIARSAEFIVQICIIKKYKLPIGAKISEYLGADRKYLMNFMKIAAPVILNEFFWALGTSIYNIAYKYSGTEAQAAVQIASTVQNMFIVVGLGAGAGSGIIIANTLGAGNTSRAIRYSRKCLVLSIILSFFMAAVLIGLSELIISFFDIEPSVKAYSQKMLYVIAAFMAFKTFNYTSIVGILRSGGDTRFCLLVDFLGVWCIGIPMAFLGSYFLHLPIYITFAMVYTEELFKFAVSGVRVMSNKWANVIID